MQPVPPTRPPTRPHSPQISPSGTVSPRGHRRFGGRPPSLTTGYSGEWRRGGARGAAGLEELGEAAVALGRRRTLAELHHFSCRLGAPRDGAAGQVLLIGGEILHYRLMAEDQSAAADPLVPLPKESSRTVTGDRAEAQDVVSFVLSDPGGRRRGRGARRRRLSSAWSCAPSSSRSRTATTRPCATATRPGSPGSVPASTGRWGRICVLSDDHATLMEEPHWGRYSEGRPRGWSTPMTGDAATLAGGTPGALGGPGPFADPGRGTAPWDAEPLPLSTPWWQAPPWSPLTWAAMWIHRCAAVGARSYAVGRRRRAGAWRRSWHDS